MERTEAVQIEDEDNVAFLAQFPLRPLHQQTRATTSKVGDTQFDVSLQMVRNRMEQLVAADVIDSAFTVLRVAAAGYDVGAVDEAGEIVTYYAWLAKAIVDITQSLASALRRLKVRLSLALAGERDELATVSIEPSAGQVAWYASDLDAEFQVDPVPISASPHLTHGPPASTSVLSNADTAGVRAA